MPFGPSGSIYHFYRGLKILFSPIEISGHASPAVRRRTANAKILKCNLSVVWTMRMFESNQVIFMSSQQEFFSAWDSSEQATRDSLVSFVREYSHHLCWFDRCDSKFSGYPFLFSCSPDLTFDLWQTVSVSEYHYWSGRHWTNFVIISLSWEGSWAAQVVTRPRIPGSHLSLVTGHGKGEVRAQTLSQPWQGYR